MKKRILVFGPSAVKKVLRNAYGGGIGAFHRKMDLYLHVFQSDYFEYRPSYHSIRKQYRVDNFVVRFVLDYATFLRDLFRQRPAAVHLISAYRAKMPREFAVAFTSKILGKKLILELASGWFVEWYEGTNFLYRWMAAYCIRRADLILAQGKPYMDYLKKTFQRDSLYYPNFVAKDEIPEVMPARLEQQGLRVFFAGYQFREKGVFELVQGCRLAAREVPIKLTFAGKASTEFSDWLRLQEQPLDLQVVQLGRLEHPALLTHYEEQDIYCYPTRHPAEGHNNSVNEAMAHGLVIVCTRQGFMGSVLNEDIAYLLETAQPEEIAQVLLHIAQHRSEARKKAKAAHTHLQKHFVNTVVHQRLDKALQRLFQIEGGMG